MRGRAAGLDHWSRASVSCYASSGCGGLPFFLGTVVAVLSGALVSMSASWRSPRALSSLLLRRVCRVVFCACGVPPPEALWRVVGGWRLRRRSTPFSLGFLGRLLLRDRGKRCSCVCGFVSGFRGGTWGGERRGVSVQPQLLRVAYVYYSCKTPLRGGRRCFSGRRGYYTEFL